MRRDSLPVEYRQYGRGIERGVIVAVQHWLGAYRVSSLDERGSAWHGVIDVMDFPGDDLAAV